MPIPFAQSPRFRMWIAGTSICLLATSGMIAFLRSIPLSYASIPDEGAPSEHRNTPSGIGDARIGEPQADPLARETVNRRSRARCAECGIVESMRQTERTGGVGGQVTAAVKVAGGVFERVTANVIASNAIPGKNYEITIRFRDGSTTVFNETSPRTWRLGSQVIVIGGSSGGRP